MGGVYLESGRVVPLAGQGWSHPALGNDRKHL